jgi:D-alanyl-D-alanine dipeptidase
MRRFYEPPVLQTSERNNSPMADFRAINTETVTGDTDELRQLSGRVLIDAGNAQQALFYAKKVTRSALVRAFIDKAAEQLSAIIQVAQRSRIVESSGNPDSAYVDDHEHWRQRAERARALAVDEPPDRQERLLEIASEYDELARRTAYRRKH